MKAFLCYRPVCSSRRGQGPVGRVVEGCCCLTHLRPPAPPDRWKSGRSCARGLVAPQHGGRLLALCLMDILNLIIISGAGLALWVTQVCKFLIILVSFPGKKCVIIY